MGFLSGLTPAGAEALSAGVNFVSNLGGSVAGGLFAANQAKKNRAFQERMYNQQVKDTIDFWKMQQDYALPSAMLQRIKDAGLNPLLMYSDGAGIQQVSQPQLPSAPHGAQANTSSFNTRIDMANLALVEAQARALDAQANRDNTQADENKSVTQGQDIFNWINDKTKDVQIALKYGDYDYVGQLIRESANRVFQSSFVNANEMAALSLQNSLAIRRQNLSEYEVGQNVMQGWEAVLNGRMQASAQMKSAFAQMMNAVTAAKVSYAQIGLMRAQAANYDEQTRFLKESRDYRVGQEYYRRELLRNDLSWADILHESNLSEQQSRTFLNKMHEQYEFTQNEYKPIDELMTPVNMLTGFGAGYLMKGSNMAAPKPALQNKVFKNGRWQDSNIH